jgi:inner membrane protein
VTPWKWAVVTDTPGAYHLSTIDSRTGETEPPRPSDTIYKLPTDLALMAAKRTPLGQAYLDWSSYPLLTEQMDTSDPHHPLTAVTFADVRYFYNVLSTKDSSGKGSLAGTVVLDMDAPEGSRIVETTFGGTPQN